MPNMIVTRELLDLFRSRRIFLHYQGHDRWNVGDIFGFSEGCALEPYGQIFDGPYLPLAFGAFSYSHSTLNRRLRVGRYCSLAKNIAWMGPAHPTTWASTSPIFFEAALPAVRAYRETRGVDYPITPFPQPDPSVTIGHDVWIGEEAMIAPGVTIGHGAIVAARTLVLKDVPPYALVVGQPARIVRYRVPEALIPRFLDLQWWRYAPDRLSSLPPEDPERFLDAFKDMIDRDPSGAVNPVMLTAQQITAVANPLI